MEGDKVKTRLSVMAAVRHGSIEDVLHFTKSVSQVKSSIAHDVGLIGREMKFLCLRIFSLA